MKTLFKLLLLVALIVYLGFAFTNLTQNENTKVCKSVNYTIVDSTHAGFITGEEADLILRKAGLYPIGRQMCQIDNAKIEKALKSNTFIDSVKCYKSPDGGVNVIIAQRLPLMRVVPDEGEEYYLDNTGHRMNPQGYVADLVIATGHITPQFAKKQLVAMGIFLNNDPFWNHQIEQIHVEKNGHLQLVPRVGNHLIEFGAADSISTKFRNLYAFYEKVLPEVGWNKYREISVEHVSQIVGRKTNEKKG